MAFLTWSLWTTDMLAYEGKLIGAINSITGPKLFYRIVQDKRNYIAIIDKERDLVVAIVDEETQDAAYRHEITAAGMEYFEAIKDVGLFEDGESSF